MNNTILYVTEALLAAAIFSNVGIIVCYVSDKIKNNQIEKGTNQTTRDIETLRQSVVNITEQVYTLKAQMNDIIRVTDCQMEKIERVNENIENTVILEEEELDNKFNEIVENIELKKVQEDIVILPTTVNNPYKEKELTVNDLINIYPEYKEPSSVGPDSVKYRFKQIIEGDSIEIN